MSSSSDALQNMTPAQKAFDACYPSWVELRPRDVIAVFRAKWCKVYDVNMGLCSGAFWFFQDLLFLLGRFLVFALCMVGLSAVFIFVMMPRGQMPTPIEVHNLWLVLPVVALPACAFFVPAWNAKRPSRRALHEAMQAFDVFYWKNLCGIGVVRAPAQED